MGKKSRRNRGRNLQHGTPTNISAGFRAHAQQFRRQGMAESFAKMDDLDRLPLQAQKDTIRKTLIHQMRTDCAMNDANPTGDGDQSPILTDSGRQAARELYSIGGDISGHLTTGAVSKFAMLCLFGDVNAVQAAILQVTRGIEKPWSRNKEMINLLETRETSMRLSPLLLTVAAGKNVADSALGSKMDHAAVVSLLLKYGARPDAKDVLGKTVCHYGAGAMATPMTLKATGMCIHAAYSSLLHGCDVVLHGLKSEEMNGTNGVVGGFDTETGRRAVFLPEAGKEVWIKPKNIRFPSSERVPKASVMLADVQDRLGSVSLHEVTMQERVDVAEFLLDEHHASIHTADLDGMSPLKMSSGGGVMASRVCSMILDAARKEGSANRQASKRSKQRCAACGEDLGENRGISCKVCGVVIYCGPACQKTHWRNGHKEECAKLAESMAGIQLERPTEHSATISFASNNPCFRGAYKKPDNVAVNEDFVVKVQAAGDLTPIMIYDETRTCEFSIHPGKPGFQEVLTETRKEPAWGGRKTFMKASFDESGNCIIYPGTAGVKAKYSW